MGKRSIGKCIALVVLAICFGASTEPASAADGIDRYLYVASPGIRDYLQYGGHGILVFDIDDGHKFVRRISLDGFGVDENGKPINVKGVCGNASTGRIYVSTKRQLICVDLLTDEKGRAVESEKVLEVDFRDGKVIAVGDQFGRGQRVSK